MKNLTSKLTIIAALLFACLIPGTSLAKDKDKPKDGGDKSGIIGHIVELVGPWQIRINEENSKFVEDIQADEFGNFKVDLKHGTYLLTPFYPAADGGGGELIGVTQAVTVKKKQFTEVELLIVHGPE